MIILYEMILKCREIGRFSQFIGGHTLSATLGPDQSV